MDGNIRGNGHYNADRRMKERDEMGYKPKEIRIAGKWFSFAGLPGIEQTLSTIGDLSYYAADLEQPFLEDWHRKLTWSLAASFLNDTPLQSIEPLLAAVNGEIGKWSQFIANTAKAYIPNGSALGVLADSISSTQKDIQGEIHEYVMMKLPFANLMLDERVDFWTGEKINDIHHPVAKLVNAVTKINLNAKEEPWRETLREIGWNGYSKINKDSTGSYEYSTAERQLIYKYMAEQQLYKKLIALFKTKKYKKQIGQLRFNRVNTNDTEQRIKLEQDYLPIIQEINRFVKAAHVLAEERLVRENPDIANTILHQRLANAAMKRGDVTAASEIQKREQETRQLLQMAK